MLKSYFVKAVLEILLHLPDNRPSYQERQLGIFTVLLVAILMGFTPQEAASLGIIGGAAVSYTHLHRSHSTATEVRPDIADVPLYLLPSGLPYSSTSLCRQQLLAAIPVSYTHLDVYKRQDIMCRIDKEVYFLIGDFTLLS